ncbi:MAG: sigma-70 family RNA polymerase sigma factor [Acetatifactor sp.]|nr:sigma-70 family RNA polymerase sigma factor [Acetatifactor sp.]
MAEKDFYLYIDGQPVKVSEEVYREYKRAEDKERYFMRRLKKGRFVVDLEGETVGYVPSREASYEQLLEADWKFPAPGEAVDEIMVKIQLLETLEKALHSLTAEERELIWEIFYLEKTEREVSAAYHLTQTAIHKRKKKILEKLKKFFE